VQHIAGLFIDHLRKKKAVSGGNRLT